MFETGIDGDRPGRSLARATEIQLFVSYLVQQMRNAPAILSHMSEAELRQLGKAVDELQRQAHLALDTAIAHRVAETETAARQVGA